MPGLRFKVPNIDLGKRPRKNISKKDEVVDVKVKNIHNTTKDHTFDPTGKKTFAKPTNSKKLGDYTGIFNNAKVRKSPKTGSNSVQSGNSSTVSNSVQSGNSSTVLNSVQSGNSSTVLNNSVQSGNFSTVLNSMQSGNSSTIANSVQSMANQTKSYSAYDLFISAAEEKVLVDQRLRQLQDAESMLKLQATTAYLQQQQKDKHDYDLQEIDNRLTMHNKAMQLREARAMDAKAQAEVAIEILTKKVLEGNCLPYTPSDVLKKEDSHRKREQQDDEHKYLIGGISNKIKAQILERDLQPTSSPTLMVEDIVAQRYSRSRDRSQNNRRSSGRYEYQNSWRDHQDHWRDHQNRDQRNRCDSRDRDDRDSRGKPYNSRGDSRDRQGIRRGREEGRVSRVRDNFHYEQQGS